MPVCGDLGTHAFHPYHLWDGDGMIHALAFDDDGWLVFYLHERDGSASEFVVLDARDVAAEPVARIPMPRRVPLGFHGNWMTPE